MFLESLRLKLAIAQYRLLATRSVDQSRGLHGTVHRLRDRLGKKDEKILVDIICVDANYKLFNHILGISFVFKHI